MSVYVAVAVPKTVSSEASNNTPEKAQTNGGSPGMSILKAVRVQSVVLGTNDPIVNNPVKFVVFPVGGDVSVDMPLTSSVSPVNTVMLLARHIP